MGSIIDYIDSIYSKGHTLLYENLIDAENNIENAHRQDYRDGIEDIRAY